MSAPTLGTPRAGAERARSIPFLLAAVAVVVVMAVLVAVFAVMRVPRLSTMSDAMTGITGRVAWSEWDNERGCAAIHVANPDGTSAVITCNENYGQVVAWPSNAIVVQSSGKEYGTLASLDPATGEEVREPSAGGDSWSPASVVVTEHSDGFLVVRLAEGGTAIWRVPAHERYDISMGSLSPDGRWVALVDSAHRLLVVPADGSVPPVVWFVDVGDAWWEPVWEGADLPSRLA